MTSDEAWDDRDVVQAVLDGQAMAFEKLVNRYQQPMFRVALTRLGQTHAADEVVQETFLAAYRYLASYKSEYSFKTWLWTILLNQCKLYGAKSGRERKHVDEGTSSREQVEALESPEGCPDEQAELGDELLLLSQWLRQLPETEADALRLRYFAEMKFHEIAETQQCSLATAKNRVRRGLSQLSQRVEERETLSRG